MQKVVQDWHPNPCLQNGSGNIILSFSRKSRLISKQDFQSVFVNPNKFTYKYLLICYRPNQSGYAKLGIMLPKRFVKRAVDRNGIRRVIRESFRLNKEKLKSLDIVITIRSEWGALDKKALRHDIGSIWQRLAN